MPENYRRVDIGGFSFLIDESADLPFRHANESRMVPRREISGDIGKENLNTTEWEWSMSRFDGGEGRLVFDSQDPGPPHYHSTDGAVDTRVPGEVSMAPIMNLTTDTGGTVTRTEGSALVKVVGTEVVSGSNLALNASGEGGYVEQTPGAVVVGVSARFVQEGDASATLRLRIRNQTDTTDVVSVTATFASGPGSPITEQTLSQTFTATAGKTYRYFAELTTFAGTRDVFVDYVESNTGGPLDDPLLVQTGLKGKVWAYDWDGTNTDVFAWDFDNSKWISEQANLVASRVVAAANTDKFQYAIFRNNIVRQFDDATANNAYTSDPAKGSAIGLAVGNNRLYGLFTQALMEYSLDQTTGLPLAGTQRAGSDVFPTPATAWSEDSGTKAGGTSQDLRQQITGTDNGVRWFINMAGEQTGIYEYSDGASRQIGKLPRGYTATAIFDYANVTWIGAHYNVRAGDPASARAGIYYIGSTGGPLRFLAFPRFHDPAPEPISYIEAHGHDVYFLQGRNIWRYDGRTGGLILDRVTGSNSPATARGLAVQDVKLWAAYGGEGVFVSRNQYPKDETVFLYSPTWDFDAPNNNKTLLAFEVSTDPLPANTGVKIEYALNRSDVWVEIPTSATTGETTHILPLYGSVSIPTTRRGRYVKWRVGLSSTDGVDTPTIHAVTLRAYVLEYEPYFEMTIRLEDEDSSLRGPKQLSGPKMAANLKTLVDDKIIVAFVDRYSDPTPGSKTTHIVIIEDPHKDLSRPGQGSARLRLKVLG